MQRRDATPTWHLYLPKLVTVLRHGYSLHDFRRDVLAGLTVAVVALPLAMALAIASGTTPEKGLHTAIIAGFLISAFGGSRVQVGGPTAAFIPVVFNVIERFGYDGLLLCTMMAGVILVAAGLLRVGALMRYMPQPVVTGFTAGIAVTIFLSQVKDALGLDIEHLPGEFFQRLETYAGSLGSFNPWSIALTLACLALIIGLRRWRPSWPGFLIAVIGGSLLALALSLPVATIGSAYGDIPSTLPSFVFPEISPSRIGELLPSALTIAFLAGVESLLSAVVADGMIGGRHRSNCELVAQGLANVGSALFGGLPATGAIARTATNVRAGARSPVAGIMHAAFLLLFMLALAPLMRWVPLPALAAVLLIIAWNMSEIERFRHLMKAPMGDRVVLLTTFGLTVMFDLTVAIQVGVMLAAFLFMHRMSEVVALDRDVSLVDEDRDDLAQERQPDMRDVLPEGVAAFRISGPLFFAVANRLDNVLDQFSDAPKVFILRMRLVPLIDASGAQALVGFLDRCQRKKIKVLLSGIQPQPSRVLRDMGIAAHPAVAGMARDFESALLLSRQIVA